MTPPDSGMEAATPDSDAREVEYHCQKCKDFAEQVTISADLAQRILAALEQEAHAGDVSAARLETLASELRAVIGK